MIMNRKIPDIAVIGSGPAGLSCAERLTEHGLQVQVFDEGRLPGGRVAVRHHVGLTFEYGAPAQQSLIQSLADRVSLVQDTRIVAMERSNGTWQLHSLSHSSSMPLRTLHASIVLAIPAPRAIALLPDLVLPLRNVQMRPILTALLCLPGPLSRAWNRISFETGSLAEARRQTPDRPGTPETWVLHASPVFSQDNLECDPDSIAQHLWHCFRDALALDITTPSFLRGHRWRHAMTVKPLEQSCWYDEQRGLGVCGDWCLGDNVNAAVTSGLTLADRILGMAERPPRIALTMQAGKA